MIALIDGRVGPTTCENTELPSPHRPERVPDITTDRIRTAATDRRQLFIIGGGGLGREIASWLSIVPAALRFWELCGFLDDDPTALGGYPSSVPVVGCIDGYTFGPGDLALVAIADPAAKQRVVSRLRGRVAFASFIADDALIGHGTTVGEGVLIGPRCILGPNVRVGHFVVLCGPTVIGHDSVVHEFASVMPSVMIAGKCEVGHGAYIGIGATLIPGRLIGEGAKVGAGSNVLQHVAPGTTVLGNPAKILALSGSGNSVPR